MKKQLTIITLFSCAALLSGCNNNDNTTLYQFQQDSKTFQQNYEKDKSKESDIFFKKYNIDETVILSNAILKYKSESLSEAANSPGINDALKKADEKMQTIKIGDVIKDFDNSNPQSKVIRGTMNYKDGYVRDLSIAYSVGFIKNSELNTLSTCINQYKDKNIKIDYQNMKKTTEELNKLNNTKISDILSECK